MVPPGNNRLRIGIVGLGLAGGLMVPALVGHARATLAAVADPDPLLRARFARDHALPVCHDAAELVCRADVDAVYIATPHQFHKAHALLAAEHGKHLIVEKPMALSLEDCDIMIAAAAQHRVALIVGHTHSFDPAILHLRALAATGAFGALSMLALSNYTDFLYRPRRPEELDTAQGGGILFNQVPHQVDVARLLAGTPVRAVRAHAGVLDARRPTEGNCLAFLEFAGGACASLVYSGYDHFDSDELHEWIGSTGRRKSARHGAARKALAALTDALADVPAGGPAEAALRSSRYGYGGSAEVLAHSAEGQSHFGSLIATYECADVRLTPQGLGIYDDDGARDVVLPLGQNGRTRLIDECCDVVQQGAPALHDGHFARGTLETCLAIRDSARQRREIVLPAAAN